MADIRHHPVCAGGGWCHGVGGFIAKGETMSDYKWRGKPLEDLNKAELIEVVERLLDEDQKRHTPAAIRANAFGKVAAIKSDNEIETGQ